MALPQVTTHQDRLLTVNVKETIALPLMDGVSLTPLFLDRDNGVWVLFGRFEPGVVLPTHFHTGNVHFFTTKGTWSYVEYPNDPQTEGSYLFEPAGSVHTLMVPKDAKEPAEGIFIVNGANVNFVNGEYQDVTDAGSIEHAILEAVKAGLVPMPKYITAKSGARFSTE